ncbi:hypothetical protein ACFL0R_01255 [Pseudomonadota bacterium]
MLSQEYKKRVAWVLIAALLNLVLIGVPGSGVVLAATHAGMPMDHQVSMEPSDCHSQRSGPMEMAHQASLDESCPECGEGCSLCFQITMAIPMQGHGFMQLPDDYDENASPRLTAVSSELILPPPISFSR